MPDQNSNTLDEIMVEVYRAIYSALERRLHLIGSVIAYLIRGKIKREGIAALRYCDPGLRDRQERHFQTVCVSEKRADFSMIQSEDTVMVFEEMVIKYANLNSPV